MAMLVDSAPPNGFEAAAGSFRRAGAKAGRPLQPGPRYPSGKLKPADRHERALPPALIKRIVADAKRDATDPRLGSVAGALHLQGEITERQFSAASAYARLRGRHDRLIGARERAAVSPDYGVGRAAGPSAGQTDKAAATAEARVKRDHAAMLAAFEGRWPIGTIVNGETPRARAHRAVALLDRVLVDDTACAWPELALLRESLDVLVVHFRITA